MKKGKHRHAFRFKVTTNDGDTQTMVAWAKVLHASAPVDLTLTADHVRRSIQLRGVGNTQTCSMAVCAKQQADKFPHPVNGYIDWQYSRAYVVTKVSKATGMPIECVAYTHDDDIAKLNDSKSGQKKLLEGLEANGEKVIRLRPIQRRLTQHPKPKGSSRTGERTSRPAAHGAKLRFAVAQLVGVE
jgi:hypothetical protein